MPALSREWVYWSLLNGLPAIYAATLFLVWPGFGKRFAWDINHRQSAIFFGTGFLFRAAMFVTVINADSWGEIRWLVGGNVVFAGVLLGVTMIWGELFDWRRLMAIGWLFLYIEEPVWMLTLVPEAYAAAPGDVLLPGADVNLFTRIVLMGEALVMLAAGLLLFFPNLASQPLWPWRPDLVTARIMAGFPLAWAAWAVTLALTPTWPEARNGVLLNIIWLGAIFASVFIFRSHFDLSRRSTRIYVGVVGVLLVLLVVAYVMHM